MYICAHVCTRDQVNSRGIDGDLALPESSPVLPIVGGTSVCLHLTPLHFGAVIELCNTIDTTRYRDTKQYRSTSSFGIVGIDYATYNQTGDDFGSHFQLIWIKLVG